MVNLEEFVKNVLNIEKLYMWNIHYTEIAKKRIRKEKNETDLN